MASHDIALTFILLLPVLILALLRLNKRDIETPTSLLVGPSGSGNNAPLTLVSSLTLSDNVQFKRLCAV